MAYSSNSSTGSVGTSSVGSSIGTPSSTSTGTSGVSVGTSASTGSTTSGNGATTSNSNGNFSGGLPGLGGGSWSSPSSETAAAHASGVQGPGLANGNFGSSWSGNGNSGSGSGDYTYNNTSYSNNKSEPTMTVDEVYGKSDTSSGNQSIVESQGDYNATSNEKSNVETSTFGKQDDITVTPESVTENKGIVDNSTIESIEGLNFQQKDKESQDVLEARKSRDDAEAKDKANQMRDSLKAKTDETLDEESAKQFQIGEENTFEEENNAKLAELNQKNQELENAKKEEPEAIAAAEKAEAEEAAANAAVEKAIKDQEQVNQKTKEAVDYINNLSPDESPLGKFTNAAKAAWDIMTNRNIQKAQADLSSVAKDYDIDVGDASKSITSITPKGLKKAIETINNTLETRKQEALNNQQKAQEVAKEARAYANEVTTKVQELQAAYETANQEYNTWKTEYWAADAKTKAEEAKAEEAANAKSNAEVSFEATKEAINNAELPEETKSKAIETVNNVEAAAKAVNEAADALAANPNDPATIETYVNAVKTYNENVKSALKGNPLAKTYLNETFTKAVAAANDFDVTLADGTKVSYAEFAAEKAVESPALAKGLYEAKAARLAEEGHTVLAAIERAKSKMVTTWLGSKLTMADNQVRNQFIQMAKTDMRATYAAHNNVLNDPNASPEAKAEASAAINQANALMTASAALQASTGFLSGIGDSMSDGVYGTTDPTTLNAYQKTLNAIDNYAKITLGLGVTPGANKAYQNMYYMAGAKVNESGLFGRDFDSDGFALCQEYGNNAAAGMITGVGELATGVALFFNPAMAGIGLNLVIDSVQTFTNGLYGVQKDARKSQQYTQEVLNYFKEAESIAAETGNKEIINSMSTTMSNAVKQIENFELKADEVGNLDNWLEGSGSNTATNEKFNQSLTYDEWLKLIEADPTMRDYAKKLISEKKEK